MPELWAGQLSIGGDDGCGAYRFTILVHIDKLAQEHIYQHAQIVCVKILRRAFGGEKKVQYFEHKELHTEVFGGTV